MKRLLNFVLIIAFLLSSFFPVLMVKAETISDLRRKLELIEQEEKENRDKIHLTESEIKNTKAGISQIYIDMDNISKEIRNKEQEIIELNQLIEDKDAETKELMKSLQLTTGGSFYLEYIFGADDITDLIYRYSITEQLTRHNTDLINEMNDTIELNERKKVELANKRVELNRKQDRLAVQLNSLSNTKEKLYEQERELEDEIKNSRAVIQMYIDAGCGEYEKINVCANRLLPPDTRFFRPLMRGYVTSEFGGRISPITGKYQIHEAIDVSSSERLNARVFAVANGRVAKIFYDIFGGNQIVLHHNINGITYSSSYAHLHSVHVKEGQTVTRDTVIGMMGSTGIYTTGPHVHLAISRGLRYTDYVSYTDYVAMSFNPRNVINFPPFRQKWHDRVTRY